MQLKFYPLVVKDGVKVAKLNPKEIEEQCKKWKTTLIGYVLGGNPSFKEMLKFVYGVWNSVTTQMIFLHDDGYFIFHFESMEDKIEIFQNGPYTFNNRPMVLKDCDPDFQIQNESMRIVPIWINLPGLPVQCWAEENLGRIASLLGKPICTDKLTAQCERISYARILVEMDITQPLPDGITIENPDGSSWEQREEFEWKPKLCMDCNKFGHSTGNCQQDIQQANELKPHKRRRKKKTRIEWKPKPNDKGNNETDVLPHKEPEQQEPVVEVQVTNRGKQAVVIQGSAGKKTHRDINYE
ncbi:PREDICTED: uncharacterized protein LOC109209025 [Nicotiana attenuata]|uniref:uncharacterized protein LOC109209025 n=1 Tax=Nicotiana attenuata TaxID=49451 RepID=UPI00090578D3|nr:PREDICTED: uncharacterized protein LOC109209025 [Nicotiana attenuata]